jgi:hypothetical protein
MHSLLHKLFEKRGIKSPDELSPEEKQTFEQWNAVLSKDDISVGGIKEFCEMQVAKIETKWRDMATDNSKKAELIPYHTVYKLIIGVISAPQSEKELLEKQLNELLQ